VRVKANRAPELPLPPLLPLLVSLVTQHLLLPRLPLPTVLLLPLLLQAVLPLLLLRLVELLLPFLASRLELVLRELAQQEPALLLVFSKELVLQVLALLLEPSKELASLPRVAQPVLALDSLPLAPLLELGRQLATVLLVTLVPTLALLPTLALPPALPAQLLATERPQAARANLLLTLTLLSLTPRRRTRSILWRVLYQFECPWNAGCDGMRRSYRNKAFGLTV
jgi:hypothetical protein